MVYINSIDVLATCIKTDGEEGKRGNNKLQKKKKKGKIKTRKAPTTIASYECVTFKTQLLKSKKKKKKRRQNSKTPTELGDLIRQTQTHKIIKVGSFLYFKRRKTKGE